MKLPAKPTLAAALAAQLGQMESATPAPSQITINVHAGGSLTLMLGGPGQVLTQEIPTSQAS